MAAAPVEHTATVDTGQHGPTVLILAGTLATLLVLTFITVAIAWADWLDFGPKINVWVAIGIATVKGTLVALYFMHLRYDKPFNAIVLIAALSFVLLFIGLALQDSLAYHPSITEYRQDPTTLLDRWSFDPNNSARR
jgi:cytochrome c oxidase subunit IV